MARLLVIRHAESTWNRAGRWQGIADPELSDLGVAQADRAGRTLAEEVAGDPFVSLISSDLRRARHTAALVGRHAAPGVDARSDEGLREYDVGEWSGLTRSQIVRGWPGVLEQWQTGAREATPGGERRSDFDRRVRAAVEGIVGVGRGSTLAVAHGGVVRAIARWLGRPETPISHLGGYWLEGSEDALRIVAPVDLLGANWWST